MDFAMLFVDEVEASFPPGLSLPPAFHRLLVWMEENDFVQTYKTPVGRYADLYPAALSKSVMCSVAFEPVGPTHAEAWIGIGTEATHTRRLAPFIQTGGDGSYAALWLDPADRIRFVHLGSGSGSIWGGVITDDPIEMLRFLAIGYEELCWPEDFDATPRELFERRTVPSSPYVFLPPTQFQDWLRTNFDVTIPLRACEIVRRTSEIGEAGTDDPFLLWVEAVQGAADNC